MVAFPPLHVLAVGAEAALRVLVLGRDARIHISATDHTGRRHFDLRIGIAMPGDALVGLTKTGREDRPRTTFIGTMLMRIGIGTVAPECPRDIDVMQRTETLLHQ